MTSKHKLRKLPVLLGGLGLSTLSLSAAATDWIIAPAVTLEQNYTDNALLTHDNEENESITVVRPSISVYREGARARVDINYAPEYRHYWEDTEDDELVHFLRGDGNVELMQDHVYLDGWASADLTTITSTGSSGIGGLTGRGDSTEVYTAGLSPYFKTRLGNVSLFEARYTLDSVTYTEDGLDDSVGQRADLVLGSGPAFSNQIWELSAMHNVVDYDNLKDDNEVSQFRGELAQQLTQQWAVAFAAGYEEYNLALNDDVDGSLWSVGVIYTPNLRTRLALGGGERAFGDDYYLDFSHRSQRTVWTASYERDYTSAREELLRPSLFERQDAFGNLVRNAVLDNPPAVDREGTPSISAEYYELERFSTSFTFSTDRTTLTLGASHTDRNYEIDVEDTRDLNVSTGLTRRVSQRTSAYLRLSWNDHEEEALNYKQYVTALGGSYQLGTNTSLGLRLAHLKRDAEIKLSSYDENSANIYFTATF
ncbi:MAG: TIGR03016 family PEP-CTERM system-associated outer membrane protein [Candidatus Thiodiazotropha sp.]